MSKKMNILNNKYTTAVKNLWLKHLWPATKYVGPRYFAFVAICAAVIMTINGLCEPFTDKYNNLFGVLTSTAGTLIAIFFSLILIPLNQISSKYSPTFLRYLKKDKFLIGTFIYSAITLIYNLIFLLIDASYPIAVVATGMFLLLICLLGFCLWHIIKISNPYQSFLLPAHKEVVSTFKKLIPEYYNACVKSQEETFKDSDPETRTLDICHFKIHENITNYIQNNLLPMREIAVKAIIDFNLEQAQNAIQTMMSVVVNYLHARKEYHSDDDPVLYFLYTEYKLIIGACSNEVKLRLYPFIVDCWRQVGVMATQVNIKGMKRMGEGANGLVTYPVQGLKDLCIQNLLEMDSYAPGKAAEAIGDIGVGLMNEGYDLQASAIIKDLEEISILAEQNNIKHVSGIANYSIMRTYIAGLVYRNKTDAYVRDYPYREINKSISNLLKTFLIKKRSTFDAPLLSSFIGWMGDPIKGINLSRISEHGLFANKELQEKHLKQNLYCVESAIKTTNTALALLTVQEDWYFSKQAVEVLYRSALNILSYLNPLMAKDHIFFYDTHPYINEELRTQAEGLIVEILNVLLKFSQAKVERRMLDNDFSHTAFTLYLIILYEAKIRPNPELTKLFEKVHGLFTQTLHNFKTLPETKSTDTLYKFYRLLVAILNENQFMDLAQDFAVPEYEYQYSGVMHIQQSEYPETMMDDNWWLLRPGLQANGYYYNNVEAALKLDKLKFY